jgi:hypothetical protein
MSFLRRIFGGGEGEGVNGAPDADGAAPDESSSDADEAARDRELLLAEAHRLDNDLIQRQMRFADRAWTPPAQGGSKRADDKDAERA